MTPHLMFATEWECLIYAESTKDADTFLDTRKEMIPGQHFRCRVSLHRNILTVGAWDFGGPHDIHG